MEELIVNGSIEKQERLYKSNKNLLTKCQEYVII